jgi:hexosaminidase
MKTNNIHLLLCAGLSLLMLGCTSEEAEPNTTADFPIIPLPQSIAPGMGSLALTPEIGLVAKAEGDTVQFVVDYLQNYLQQHHGFQLESGASAKKITFEIDPSFAGSYYEMLITQKGALIKSATPAGLFHGVQSLLQLVDHYRNPAEALANIPCGYIKDEPRFAYRGMHLDVGRHMFPVAFIKQYIDMLAHYKMNRFHWHLTEDQGWRIEIKQYPKLQTVAAYRPETLVGHYGDQPQTFDGQRYGGYYTQKEVREVVQYAKERFVTIIPEIEMPGHAQAAIAAYPELSCHGRPVQPATKWGVFENIYCPTEETFTFLENVLTEVMDLFPSEYIHIGGDEAPKKQWEESAFCQQLIAEEGLEDEAGLQSYFIRRIETFLNENGRSLIGWDEILEGGLAPNATVMSWRGEQGGIEAAEAGHDVIMTPNSHCYFDHYQSRHPGEPLAIGGYLPLEKVYSYHPIPEELDEEEAKHILGAQGNLWTEYIPTTDQAEYMAYPRMMALAEVNWTGDPGRKDFEDFVRRLEPQIQRWRDRDINVATTIYDARSGIQANGVDPLRLTWSNTAHSGTIRFTKGGAEEVTRESPVYDGPIQPEESGTYSAQTFAPEGPVGRTGSITINLHKGVNKAIVLAAPPTEPTNPAVPQSLLNGVQGAPNDYRDGEWLSFREEPFEATIDLGQPDTLHRISTRFFVRPGWWIYAPERMEVTFAKNQDEFGPPRTFGIPEPDGVGAHEVSFAVDAIDVQFIRIKLLPMPAIPAGQPGAGTLPHVMVDELVIE